MSHGFSIDTLSQETLLPNQPFFSWLRTQTALFTSQILALLTLVSALASLAYYVISLGHEGGPIEPKNISMMVVYAHLVFLVIFIAALIRVLNDNDQGSYRVSLVYERLFGPGLTAEQSNTFLEKSKARLQRFKIYFLAFWCSMLLLYAGFAFKYGVELSASRAQQVLAKESVSIALKGKQDAPEEVVEAHASQTHQISLNEAAQTLPAPKHEVAREVVDLDVAPVHSVVPAGTAGIGPTRKNEDPEPAAKGEIAGLNTKPNYLGKRETAVPPEPQPQQKQSRTPVDDRNKELRYQLILSFIPFALNNLSLMFVFWCFVVLYLPSKRGKYVSIRLRARVYRIHKRRTRLPRPRISGNKYPHFLPRPDLWRGEEPRRSKILRSALGALLFLLKPNRELFLLVLSGIVVAGFIASFWLLQPSIDQLSYRSIRDYTVIFDTLSGILNGIVLALLIARLDSKLIGLPSWLISILYLYAAVQPLFLAFEVFDTIATAVLIVVFIFKIYFFLIIMYTLQTGRMLNYFFCFPFVARRLGNLRTQKRTDLSRDSQDSPTPVHDGTGMWSPRTTRAISIVLGLLGLAWLWFWLPYFAREVAIGTYGDSFIGSANWKLAFDVIHLIVVLPIIFFINHSLRSQSEDTAMIQKICEDILKDPSPRPEALKKSALQLRTFKVYFLLFWVFIFGLYFVLGCKHLAERRQSASASSTKSVAQAVPFSGGLFLGTNAPMLGGIEIQAGTQPTVPAATSADQQHGISAEGQLIDLGQIVQELWVDWLVFLFNNGSLLFLLSCFLILYLPALDDDAEKKQKLVFHYGMFFVILLTVAFPALITLPAIQGMTRNSVEAYKVVFLGISGTLNAVALALLIARLDSKLFDISSFLIFVLLTYAGLQPLFVIFESQTHLFIGLQTLVIFSALLFKFCFFLILLDSWRTGTMRAYLFCFPLINKRIDSIFENQFEFKTARAGDHGFSLSIFKKKSMVYSTNHPFKTRAMCDDREKRLRKLMENENNYAYGHEAGTHWIIVHEGDRNQPLCESEPLRSKEEAKKLVDESIDKVPFCKYNRS